MILEITMLAKLNLVQALELDASETKAMHNAERNLGLLEKLLRYAKYVVSKDNTAQDDITQLKQLILDASGLKKDQKRFIYKNAEETLALPLSDGLAAKYTLGPTAKDVEDTYNSLNQIEIDIQLDQLLANINAFTPIALKDEIDTNSNPTELRRLITTQKSQINRARTALKTAGLIIIKKGDEKSYAKSRNVGIDTFQKMKEADRKLRAADKKSTALLNEIPQMQPPALPSKIKAGDYYYYLETPNLVSIKQTGPGAVESVAKKLSQTSQGSGASGETRLSPPRQP